MTTLAKVGGCGVLVLVAVVLPLRDTQAQDSLPRSPAAEVAHSLRTYGGDSRGLAILTQAYGPQPRSLMNEVADTLAAVAIGLPGHDQLTVRATSNAISSLYLAGIGETGLSGTVKGIPYAGAAERLKRVSESSGAIRIRGPALHLLSDLDKTPQLLSYLRQIAVSNSPIAHVAVEVLLRNRGADGHAIARELYRSGVIKDELALRMLQGAAATYGW